MNLLFPVYTIILIQLFWLTFTLLGLVFTLCIQSVLKDRYIQGWSTLPLAGKLLISVATSFFAFSLVTIIGYAFRLPGLWLGLSTVALTVSGLGLAVFYVRRQLHNEFRLFVAAAKSVPFFSPVGVLIIVVALDYAISLYIGSYLTGDAPVHMAKMAHILRDGFTLEDSYFGGVPEVRHHINVMHTVYAIPLLFKATAEQSWFLAIGFLKIVKVFAVYFLAWRLTEKYGRQLRIGVASAAAICSIALFSSYTAAYPMDFVSVWVCLFIIGLLDLVVGKRQLLLIIACVLMALTHPLVAMAGIILLAICLLGLLAFSRKTVSKYLVLSFAACVLILASTPVFTLMLPNQMSVITQNAEIEQTPLLEISGATLFRPTFRQYTMIQTLPFIAGIALIGMFGLAFAAKKRQERIVVISLMLVGPVILNNPLAYEILRNSLPPWAMYRIGAINQLYLLYPVFGVLFIFALLGRFEFASKFTSTRIRVGFLLILSLIVLVTCNSFARLRQNTDRNASIYQHQLKSHKNMADIKGILPADPRAIVFANDYESIMIPSVSSLRILRMRDSRSTPAADVVNRTKCYNLIERDFDPGLLKQTGVKYVLVREKSALLSKVSGKSYLKRIDYSQERALYQFDPEGVASAKHPDCEFRE